jgi:hypothetical protein
MKDDMSNEKRPCVYLFNLKEMNKPIEPLDQEFKRKKLDELNEFTSNNNLRPQIAAL